MFRLRRVVFVHSKTSTNHTQPIQPQLRSHFSSRIDKASNNVDQFGRLTENNSLSEFETARARHSIFEIDFSSVLHGEERNRDAFDFPLMSFGSIMVGEIDSVSPTFSLFRGGLFWLGGFAIIFLTIVVIVSLSDSANSTISTRNGTVPTRGARSADNEPSMGLTPETAAPAQVEN